MTPMGVNPRVKSYKVSAIFEIGMSEYDASIIFMPLEEAQLYFNAEGIAQSIETLRRQSRRLSMSCGRRSRRRPDGRSASPTGASATRPSSRRLQVERNVMFMILTLIVLVAALNIISGLIMLVKDKGSDIAILRTMGATSRRHHADLLHDRRGDRHRRHVCRRAARRRRLPQHRIDPPVLLLDFGHDAFQSASSISSASCRRK